MGSCFDLEEHFSMFNQAKLETLLSTQLQRSMHKETSSGGGADKCFVWAWTQAPRKLKFRCQSVRPVCSECDLKDYLLGVRETGAGKGGGPGSWEL